MIVRRLFLNNKVTQWNLFKLTPLNPCLGSPILYSSSSSHGLWNRKETYRWFLPVQTRWKDNDQYLHVNNAVYHAIFDSVINVYLIRRLGLDIQSTSTPRGYMVTNSCTFQGSAAYPEVYLAGLAVSKLGNTSVRYKLGLFPLVRPQDSFPLDLVQGHDQGEQQILDRIADTTIVTGDYVHVFVEPATEKSTPVPSNWREGLGRLLVHEVA